MRAFSNLYNTIVLQVIRTNGFGVAAVREKIESLVSRIRTFCCVLFVIVLTLNKNNLKNYVSLSQRSFSFMITIQLILFNVNMFFDVFKSLNMCIASLTGISNFGLIY